jgi:hypothetical protein
MADCAACGCEHHSCPLIRIAEALERIAEAIEASEDDEDAG